MFYQNTKFSDLQGKYYSEYVLYFGEKKFLLQPRADKQKLYMYSYDEQALYIG